MKFTSRILKSAVTLDVSPNDPGLKTWEEFKKAQNPSGKIHEEGAYDWSLEEMNRIQRSWVGEGMSSESREKFEAYRYEKGWAFFHGKDMVGVTDGHTLWLAHPWTKVPKDYWINGKKTEVPTPTPKKVKYPQEFLDRISTPKVTAEYPKVVQNLGQYQLRSSGDIKDQKHNYEFKLGLFHKGLLVAVAQDEWGATLISVAQEYRGKGLGPIMRKYWGKFRPDYTSGGYTRAGQRQAYKVWSNRVRELMSHGVYTHLIQQGKMTKEKAQEIIQGAQKSTEYQGKTPDAPTSAQGSGKLLLLVDNYQFVLYDPQFFEDQEDSHVKAFGFLRSSPHVGTFYYKLEYDYQFRGIANAIALQLAKDEGEKLYIGKGYGDMLEPEGLPTQTEGDYISLTKDVLDIKSQGRKERAYRKTHDNYEEGLYALLEAANSKEWNP